MGNESGVSTRSTRCPVHFVRHNFTILNESGLHARPAAELVRQAGKFRSEIFIVSGGESFSAQSLIEVMRANLTYGSVAYLEANGPDAREAVSALRKLLENIKE